MATHTDPVCGMQVEEQMAGGQSEYLEQTYYFCSEGCRKKFDQSPETYAIRSGQAQSIAEQAAREDLIG